MADPGAGVPQPEPPFAEIRSRVEAATGLSLGGFKENFLRRRLDARRRVLGLGGLGDYLRVLARDPREAGRLEGRLTIHVTEFFRDPDAWDFLRSGVLPTLLDAAAARPGRSLRIWSAGCSTGEEAYSLALVALEGAERQGLGVRPRVLASDLDPGVLARAAEGVYPARALEGLPGGLRARWFVPDPGGFRASPGLRRAVAFRRLDLFNDPPPPGVDLLLCRNVMIYFSRDVQQRLLAAFRHALAPEGILMTGKTETVLGPARARFRCLSASCRVFRAA